MKAGKFLPWRKIIFVFSTENKLQSLWFCVCGFEKYLLVKFNDSILLLNREMSEIIFLLLSPGQYWR